jgi:hypothetical protein
MAKSGLIVRLRILAARHVIRGLRRQKDPAGIFPQIYPPLLLGRAK